MPQYVRETAAGKSISAYVIMKGGKIVATVHAHFSNSGRCLVNVFQNDKAARKCAAKAGVPFPSSKPSEQFDFQSSSASGYGYDKFTAALSGLMIDGHRLNDHCGARLKLPKGATVFPEGFKTPKGYRLANWRSEENGYSDCYRMEALRYLAHIGYVVENVI